MKPPSMGLDQGLGPLSITPPSSGRASPVSRRRNLGVADDEAPTKDKAYRRYASGVERSLSLFDTQLQEWADYISFLGRLLKSLQQHPTKIAVIPSKALVAKRLSQCLNPTLPSGVHQKALEVYNFIFSLIGREALSRDLYLYLPGLSSTLSFASLSVRSPFLSILETHLLKLEDSALRPYMRMIILSLLPGLEEETSEDFERTLKLLDGFKLAVRSKSKTSDQIEGAGDEYFWQCFFLASITSDKRRAGALAYLVRNLPRLGGSLRRESIVSNGGSNGDSEPSADQLADIVTTPEPSLLLRCFAAGLGDDQILIQRGFLDLLVTHLPIHSNVLQRRVKPEDLELLLTAATGVVTRRDMSLNRRLWIWLMGPEPTEVETEIGPESPTSVNGDSLGNRVFSRTRYFEEYGLQPLTQAILKMIDEAHVNPVARARPFRICLSLMDRWEIGGLVVPEIFLPVISGVRKYKDQALSRADFNDVLRSASVFFDGVESGLIWGELLSLLDAALRPGKLSTEERRENLSLVNFVITHFNVREEEMLMIHAPITAVAVLAMIDNIEMKRDPSFEDEGYEAISSLALGIALDLIDLIPERAFVFHQSSVNAADVEQKHDPNRNSNNDLIIKQIKVFYGETQGNLDEHDSPIPPRICGDLLLRESGRITSQSLNCSVPSTDIGLRTKLLCKIILKTPKADSLDSTGLLASIRQKILSSPAIPFPTFVSIMHVLTSLYPKSYISQMDISGLVDTLVRVAWSFLSPNHPKYHVETVRQLWHLQNTLSMENHEIESSICAILTEKDVSGTFAARDADPGRRFGVLWTHTLQDGAGYGDRRGSSSTIATTKGSSRGSAADNYAVMLARPLFLLLDSLEEERTQLFKWMRTWLQSSNGIEKLFHLFITRFASFAFLRFAAPQKRSDGMLKQSYADDDDLDGCLYYLNTLCNVLRWSSDHTWDILADHTVSTDKAHVVLHEITGIDGEITLQEFFVHVCMLTIAGNHDSEDSSRRTSISQLHTTSLSLLQQLLQGPHSMLLADLKLEYWLIDRLSASLSSPDPFVQASLLDVVFAALKLQNSSVALQAVRKPRRSLTQESLLNPRPSFAEVDGLPFAPPPPPSTLVKCLQAGFSAESSRPILDSWISFLTDCMPLYTDSVFQILIPLVETLCAQIGQAFANLQKTFKEPGFVPDDIGAPEPILISLLNGLEQVLARGHERLVIDEARAVPVKSPEQPQGFFGNMMPGVFTTEMPQARSITANNRLTVLLSFQDAVRICYQIWSWGGEGNIQDSASSASFTYTSLRMRNRARRLLEQLFAVEALECLETVVDIWQKSIKSTDAKQSSVFNLLQVLDGSRPKLTIPAIFKAIYSRTNPSALEPTQKSTLTSSLLDTDLVVFLVEYAKSLDDDAMDEIWSDCMVFLRDLLANPFPHRQTLPSLLEFAAILGEKADNTNFGEQRKMRRELADLFLRLLTATFTTKPMGFSEAAPFSEKSNGDEKSHAPHHDPTSRSEDVVGILASIAPNLPKILVEPDRVLSAATAISANVVGPTFRSKAFPENISQSILELLYHLARLPNTQKIWRKDLDVAFNDAKFFSNSVSLIEKNWLPLLRQWTLSDKERMPELLSRLTPPTTAGIVFGVGATSARLEADRKTQLNLRRIATLILAAADESFINDLPTIQEKLVELMTATTTSSPSSTTRAELYMVLRALVLKTSAIHLASLWPIVSAELHAAISSVISPDNSQTSQTYNPFAVLQACKLLDTLLCIAPDDFQLYECLFITDTIDAVHRPPSSQQPIALIDELSEELGATSLPAANETRDMVTTTSKGIRRPLLGPGGISDDINLERKEDLIAKVLRPFFGQLSIFCFESVYGMGQVDLAGLREGLVRDLFDERGIVKGI